jgi:hypothetical protein
MNKSKFDIWFWVIGILGMFILSPVIDILIGIGFLIYASSEKQPKKQETAKLYGCYWIFASICYVIVHIF